MIRGRFVVVLSCLGEFGERDGLNRSHLPEGKKTQDLLFVHFVGKNNKENRMDMNGPYTLVMHCMVWATVLIVGILVNLIFSGDQLLCKMKGM